MADSAEHEHTSTNTLWLPVQRGC